MNLLRVAVLAVLAQNTSSLREPPTPPTGTASIEGIVIRLGTNDPISRVDLELNGGIQGGPPQLYATKSGIDGKFVFRNVTAGDYKLVAARVGGIYTPVEYGQRGTLGRGVLFPLAEGEHKTEIRLEMAPTGSISGRVFDAQGRPVGHAAVMALTPIYKRSERTMSLAQYILSDDHGDFRLFSLPPGEYYVAAKQEDATRRTVPLSLLAPGSVQSADRSETPVVTRRVLPTGEVVEETYRIVYYGGGIDPERATPLDLGPAANLVGIDIHVSEGVTVARHIRGKAMVTPGNLNPGVLQIRAIPAEGSADTLIPIAVTDTSGVFDLAGAIPGKYLLFAVKTADTGTGSSVPMIGMTPVEVGNKDIENISIITKPVPKITGKIVIEGQPDNDPALTRFRISLRREPDILARDLPSNYSASPMADGTFSLQGFPADWWLTVDTPPSTYIKSIRTGSRDLLSNTIHIKEENEIQTEILIGTDGGELEGTAFGARQEPVVNATIVLVPEPPFRRRWDRYKTVFGDLSGRFKISGIAPGDYKVFAWEEIEDNAWTSPEFLTPDEFRGQFLHVSPSDMQKMDVTVIPAKRK